MNGADLAVLVVPFLDGSSNRVEAGTDLEASIPSTPLSPPTEAGQKRRADGTVNHTPPSHTHSPTARRGQEVSTAWKVQSEFKLVMCVPILQRGGLDNIGERTTQLLRCDNAVHDEGELGLVLSGAGQVERNADGAVSLLIHLCHQKHYNREVNVVTLTGQVERNADGAVSLLIHLCHQKQHNREVNVATLTFCGYYQSQNSGVYL